jgi:hypothetical protein
VPLHRHLIRRLPWLMSLLMLLMLLPRARLCLWVIRYGSLPIPLARPWSRILGTALQVALAVMEWHVATLPILFRRRPDELVDEVRQAAMWRGEPEVRDVSGDFEVQRRVECRAGFSHRLQSISNHFGGGV